MYLQLLKNLSLLWPLGNTEITNVTSILEKITTKILKLGKELLHIFHIYQKQTHFSNKILYCVWKACFCPASSRLWVTVKATRSSRVVARGEEAEASPTTDEKKESVEEQNDGASDASLLFPSSLSSVSNGVFRELYHSDTKGSLTICLVYWQKGRLISLFCLVNNCSFN